MKRLLLILISIFLTINIVGAGVVQYHHHHHGDPSICLCITLDHVDDYHTGDGDCCANDCNDSSESNDCHHALHLDDFNVEKLVPNNTQIVDFQILGILINNILHGIISEPVTHTLWVKDRAVAATDLCDSDAAKRRGPPQC